MNWTKCMADTVKWCYIPLSAQDGGMVFNYSISERLGTSNNKEQYAFIYR